MGKEGKAVEWFLKILGAVFRRVTMRKMVLPANLYLKQPETDCMLWMAISPDPKYPLCRHPAITHTSGTAVAGMVTRGFAREVAILRDRFINCGRQMTVESEPHLERLKEYSFELAMLRRDLVRVAQRGYLNGSSEGMLIGEVFARLDGGKAILREIFQILSSMETLVSRIDSVMIAFDDDNASGLEIGAKLKENGIEVQKLGDRLADVKNEIYKFKTKVEKDWTRDLDQIWDVKCRPKAKQRRQCGCFNRTEE